MAAEIYVLRIDNAPLHVLTRATRERLLRELREAQSDNRVHTILLVGSEMAFSVGADLAELAGEGILRTQKDKARSSAAYVEAYKTHNLAPLVYELDQSNKPVVSLISGMCFGGGLELAMGTRYRFCSQSSQFRLPEVTVGIVPGALGTQLLPRLVGFDVALQMCSNRCDMLTAKQALQSGLVDQIVSAQSFDGLLAATVSVLRNQIARGQDSASPFRQTSRLPVKVPFSDAVKMSNAFLKLLPPRFRGGLASRSAVEALLASVQSPSFLSGALVESEISRRLVVSDEAQALRYLFFAEKALNQRSTKTVVTADHTSLQVGIVGAGVMGVGIAVASLLGGYRVVLTDVSDEAVGRGRASLEKILSGIEAKSKRRFRDSGAASAKELLDNKFNTSSAMQTALRDCDFVIEAVFEDLTVKVDVFQQLDGACHARTILCSNTSSLDVDVLAASTKRPDKVLGLHFFSPAHIMSLVEIIPCKETSPEAVDRMQDFVKKIGKVGVLVANMPGFVGNRMVFVYFLEALLCLEDGASVQAVDAAIRDFGMPMGPFQMADLSGLDVGYRIRQQQGLVDETTRPSGVRYSAIADELYRLGRMGQKSKLGFYQYKDSAKAGTADPLVDEVVQKERHKKGILTSASQLLKQQGSNGGGSGLYLDHHGPTDSSSSVMSAQEVTQRLLFALANEGFKLLGEGGVLSYRPGDIDIIYVRGYGWPSYLGGPLFWSDLKIGLTSLLAQLQTLFLRFPESPWFRPAPLLIQMVSRGLGVVDLQKNPQLVKDLLLSVNSKL
jgi:3-hydroxyacyl-CoA dehydrogenase/enoyl-CoA hydratase/carnithine racemase